MDQIYYTQCPVGYGLGASGGLQIKRIDDAYPASSDLRHLGLKAFLGTSRTMAPTTLRYARDGEFAEVARLTPREKEYHTERGLWGRPGGHFAHGLRLSRSELAAIANWPAGLFDWPGWRLDDPEPSLGNPPEPLAETWPIPFEAPKFEAMAAKARGLNVDAGSIAALLTAMAEAVRGDRAVFLIDEAVRLPNWIAVLTFAIPEALRPSLTFSTYHDRPEDLPGFRLHGTVPAARPNRAMLAGLGVVVDLAGGVEFSTPITSEAWAITLANWFIRGDGDSEAAWRRVGGLIARAIEDGSVAIGEVWGEDWLGRIFGFEEALRSSEAPANDEGWSRLSDLASWSSRMGLGEEWRKRRPSGWWKEHSASAASPTARAALRTHATLSPDPDWAETAATWHREGSANERFSAIDALLRASSEAARGGVLAAFVRGLPESSGDDVLDRLASHPLVRPAIRLPLEARRAVAATRGGEDRRPLHQLLSRAFADPEAIRGTFDAVEAEIRSNPGLEVAASMVFAELIRKAPPGARKLAIDWALGIGPDRASAWLSTHLYAEMVHPDYQRSVRALWDGTPEAARPTLAVAALTAARDPNLGREVFPWAVEALLLTIPAEKRPEDAHWPGAYMRRMPSGYELSHKLYFPATRNPELLRWIEAARKVGNIDDAMKAQLDRCKAFAKVLASGDAKNLREIDIPNVPESDRGALLGDMIASVGGASFEGLDFCLDACRVAWPDAFRPGSSVLASMAGPLASSLAPFANDPPLWFDRLVAILDRLGLRRRGSGFEPDGLASEVVAEATRRVADPWKIRDFLLRRDDAWRCLVADARKDVGGDDSVENLGGFRRWDEKLTRNARLLELLLNASSTRTLARVVQSRADDRSQSLWADELRSIGPLSWWDRPIGAADDLRDRFAREVPLAPLYPDALIALKRWLGTPGKGREAPKWVESADDSDFLLDGDAPRPEPAKVEAVEPLSALGRARWMVLYALSTLNRPGIDAEGRWLQIAQWARDGLPVGRLDVEDRRRLVAWLIFQADRADEGDLPSVAAWLIREGLDPVEESGRWKTWSRALDGLAPAEDVERARVLRVRFVDALRENLRVAAGGAARGIPRG